MMCRRQRESRIVCERVFLGIPNSASPAAADLKGCKYVIVGRGRREEDVGEGGRKEG